MPEQTKGHAADEAEEAPSEVVEGSLLTRTMPGNDARICHAC